MKKKSLLTGLLVLATSLTLGGCALLDGDAQDWNEYQLKFRGEKSKSVYVKLDLEDDSDLNKVSDTKYTLEMGPNEVYSYEYFESLDDMKESLVNSTDSDGETAGGGTYYDNAGVIFEPNDKFEYTALFDYYNPITVTELGEYDPESSSVIATSYVYEIPETGEIIVFGFDTSYDGSVHKPEMLDLQLVEVIE